MPLFKTKNIKIIGMTAAVPNNKFCRDEFVNEFGEEAVAKFIRSTGIASIHRALEEQTASDLGYAAAEKLLEEQRIDRSKIGIMVFVTQSPDYRRPATACVLQKRLSLSKDCAAMDVGLGCSGFIYGHQTIGSMLQASESKYGLLILGETASKLVNPKDKSIAMMYGDAGAAILYKKEPDVERYTVLKTDGDRFKSIILPAGGFRDMYPKREIIVCSDGIERTKYDIHMDGVAVFSFSTSDVPETIKEYLEQTNSTLNDYDLVLLHQANSFIIKQIAKRVGISSDKIPVSLDRYGNTGGVSIPLTLCDFVHDKRIKDGNLNILACGFGIGLSWGVTNFSIPISSVLEVFTTSDYYLEGKISPTDY